MSELVCDFCCSKDKGDKIAWDYPCKTFTNTMTLPKLTVHGTSHENWAACNTCHGLVQANDSERLAQRSVEKFFANEGADIKDVPVPMVEAMKECIRKLHDSFFTNRLGLPKAVR